MRESEPWRPNILPLLCRIEPQSSSKVSGQLALPFKQVLPSAVIQQVLEEQESTIASVRPSLWSVGMDVTSLDSEFKQWRQPVIAWLAAAGRRFPQQIPELQQSPQTLTLSMLNLLKRTAMPWQR